MFWYVYILRCSNGSYYVGHTKDLAIRLMTHNAGKGSKHTAKYRPVVMVYTEETIDKNSAIRRERQLKKWTRAKKEALIQRHFARLKELAQCRSQHGSAETSRSNHS